MLDGRERASRAQKPLRLIGLEFLLLAVATVGQAQTLPFPDEGRQDAERPGLFRVGAWYLTPYLNVGSLGIDTNVFYTATARQTDFIASGGPGLEVVRPFGEKSRVRLDGGLNYLWFAKTESQRKLNWYGSALLDLRGVKTTLVIEERYGGTYSRPSFEVDTRVQRETEGTRGLFTRRLGDRHLLALEGERRQTTAADQEYLGTELGRTLTENQYDAGGELRRALSVKTSLVIGGEQSWYRFPLLPARDGQGTIAYGGLRTDETALISGRALGGYRWFRLERDAAGDRSLFYADVDATWNLSPKTKLGASFLRDLDYSAFATAGPSPTLLNEHLELSFDKVLAGSVYVRLFGRQIRVISSGDLVLEIPGEGLVQSPRDDRVREGGVEIGYELRARVRVGVSAVYTDRRSNIETFGISGLLAGLTVTYNPPQATFR